jgi:hypothetical protein
METVGGVEDTGGDIMDLWLAGVNGLLNVNESGEADKYGSECKELAGVEMKDKLPELDGVEDTKDCVANGDPMVFEEVRRARGFLFGIVDHGVVNLNEEGIEFELVCDTDTGVCGSLNLNFVYSGTLSRIEEDARSERRFSRPSRLGRSNGC